ncbi:MAG: hypothetical protein DRI24_03930 [Deltaproteobacteria bacterium]|nr:MAG: hypothetical protein DRI24_03930 [Deltaproteobacteria bacterium]RLE03891.1 MAG: hypothetical protein DRJ13_04060 [Bacteroidota bacterium]
MHQGRIVFSQLLDFLPKKSFHTCVKRYGCGSFATTLFNRFKQFELHFNS